ncbi:amidase family protein [Acetobacteraceae bacterium H6797]|nr:amidase family protein [Acetobacteraceae bacterium H6797]
MDELWQWDATALAAAIRTGQVSSREATEAVLSRVERFNPRLNAIVEGLGASALAQAEQADAARRSGEALGPLHGVPVTIKVNIDQEGLATTNGAVKLKNHLAPSDSPVVANWRKAGAVFIGRTNTPALSMRWYTDNALHGRTTNPWHAGTTPGGSSGGAGVAIAAGFGPLAHGNDIGGSIRYPAYCNGVMGLRPTIGRVPAYNPSQASERLLISQISSVQGPLARSIRDLRLATDAMAGRDPRDPWWVPAPPLASEARSAKPVRVALFAESPDYPIAPAVSEALRQAAKWLEEAGHEVVEAMPPRFAEATNLWSELIITEGQFGLLPMVEEYGDNALRKLWGDVATFTPPLGFANFMAASARRSTILREWQVFLESHPVLLMPTSWQLPYPVDGDQQGAERVKFEMDGLSPLMATAILGLPGLSVPTGTANGLPVGVQLVTARYREALALELGEVIEARAPKVKVWGE